MTAGSRSQSIPSKLIVYPELIVHNGKILTADEQFSIVKAVGPLDDDLADWPKDRDTRLVEEQRQRLRSLNSGGDEIEVSCDPSVGRVRSRDLRSDARPSLR